MNSTDQKIDELAAMVARGFADIEERMATKEDLLQLRRDMDIMLDRHVGTFRRDYDELAARVRKLEDLVATA